MGSTAGGLPQSMAGLSERPKDLDKQYSLEYYILDWCRKQGFTKTARELCSEASLPRTYDVQLDAKESLKVIFEWWSVFRDIVNARESGPHRNGPVSDDTLLLLQMSQNARHMAARQPPFNPAMQRPPTMINGVMSNGQPAGAIGQPPLGGMPFAPAGAVGMNGIGVPQMMAQAYGPGQIQQPMMAGAPRVGLGHQRVSSQTQYPSSPSAHNLALNNGPAQSPGQQNVGHHGPPPNSNMPRQPVPMNNMQNMQQPGQPSQNPTFPNHVRPQSRADSPGRNMVPHGSPSMVNQMRPSELQINNEYRQNFPQLVQLRGELGFGDRDMNSLSTEEQAVMLNRLRQLRTAKQGIAGPSGQNPMAMVNRAQPGAPLQQIGAQSQAMNRSMKRGSVSPPAADSPKNDASPSANKKLRPSPGNDHATSPLGAGYPATGGQPQQPNPMNMRQPVNGMAGPLTQLTNNPTLAHMGQQNMGSPQMHPMQIQQGLSPHVTQLRQVAMHQQQQARGMPGQPLMSGPSGSAIPRPPFAGHPNAPPQPGPSQIQSQQPQQPLQPPPQPKVAATPSPGKEPSKDLPVSAASAEAPGPSTPAGPTELNGSNNTQTQTPSLNTASPLTNNAQPPGTSTQNPQTAPNDLSSIFSEGFFGQETPIFPEGGYDPFAHQYGDSFGAETNEFEWALTFDHPDNHQSMSSS